MQSGYEGSDQQLGSYSQKSYGRTPSMGDQQGNLSVEIWNRAFRDASERLCPLRSEGHECGCLHMLARLVSTTNIIVTGYAYLSGCIETFLWHSSLKPNSLLVASYYTMTKQV